MKKNLAAVALISLLLLVSACLVPENFVAMIDLDKKGNFQFTYNGTIVFVPFMQGNPSKKDIAGIKSQLAKDPGFKKIEYQGNGRYQVSYHKAGRADKPFYFFGKEAMVMSLMSNQKGWDWDVHIQGLRLSPAQVREYRKMGVKMEGELQVRTDAQVMSHNATEPPKSMDDHKIYTWKINSPKDPAPDIWIKLR